MPRDLPSSPLLVEIAITGRCNLHCQYCFYGDEMAALNDLPTERWLDFLDELGRLAVYRIVLTGGEPFTRPDLFVLIDRAIENRMRYSILTNGTLIDERLLARFDKGKRRLRLDSIQVSIDGSRAEIHNRSRPGSFDRALRGLRLLVEAGFPATVRVTVNRYNVDDLEDIAWLLLEDVGLHSFTTNEAEPGGVAAHNPASIMLTPAQRLRAMETLSRLAERYEGRIGASAGPLALARLFGEIEQALAEGRTSLPGRGTLSGCGGVWTKMAVQHDGTMVPCHWLGSLHMGTIGVDDLQEVWLHHPLINRVRRRRDIPLESLETCRDCAYRGFCTGGCPGLALLLTGEMDAPSPMSCYRLHLEGANGM